MKLQVWKRILNEVRQNWAVAAVASDPVAFSWYLTAKAEAEAAEADSRRAAA